MKLNEMFGLGLCIGLLVNILHDSRIFYCLFKDCIFSGWSAIFNHNFGIWLLFFIFSIYLMTSNTIGKYNKEFKR